MALFINIGFGNVINSGRIISIMSYDSAPAKRLAQNAKDDGTCIDATQGRRTKSVLVMTEGYVVLSALQPETIAARCNQRIDKISDEDGGR